MGKQITLSGRLCLAIDGHQKTNSGASLGFLRPYVLQELFLLSDFFPFILSYFVYM